MSLGNKLRVGSRDVQVNNSWKEVGGGGGDRWINISLDRSEVRKMGRLLSALRLCYRYTALSPLKEGFPLSLFSQVVDCRWRRTRMETHFSYRALQNKTR